MDEFRRSCPSCGGGGLPLRGYERAWLHRCGKCRLAFSSRRPDSGELEKNYAAYPRHFDMDESTISRYRSLLKDFEKARLTGRILDIGCGSGHFLLEAAKTGWNTWGTEYSDEAIRSCESKGITGVKKTTSGFGQESFDVITMIEVLEHLPEPAAELRAVSRLLRPGGILYITTPNFNSLSRRIARSRWNVIEWPDHLTYFTPATLHTLLSNEGFRRQQVLTTGLSFQRIRQSIGAGTQAAAGSDHKLRAGAEKWKALGMAKAAVNFILSVSGAGDTIKATYTR